mmetsp:Transcript_41090/g.102637  ORF Transcript_41090/g.102637 Transcript_41090/m.102637 type:complete len:285 (+) Transcript_41090:1237-2091(+)
MLRSLLLTSCRSPLTARCFSSSSGVTSMRAVGVSYNFSRRDLRLQILANTAAALSGYGIEGTPFLLRSWAPRSTSEPPIQLAITGTRDLWADGSTISAVFVGSVMSCGESTTSIPSLLGSSATTSTALAYVSGDASPNTSTGLEWLQAGGRNWFSLLMVDSSSVAISASLRAAASVASTPGPPAFVMITKRGPFGRFCFASVSATSNSSPMVSTRKTPARFMAASKMLSAPASEPVWDEAALAAASVRPALMTIKGFFSATSLAADRKARASPIASIYINMESV